MNKRYSSRTSITVFLLGNYFPAVKGLRAYLSEILEPLPQTDARPGDAFGFEPNNSDSPLYSSLVDTCQVALKTASNVGAVRPRFKVFPVMVDIREVLDKAQERILRSKRSKNILTAGYKLGSDDGNRGKQGLMRSGIINYFVNTIITAFQSPEWETLLRRIGEDAMLHILCETSIFVSLPNDCLCQMTGEPIIYAFPINNQIMERRLRTTSKRLIEDDQVASHPKRRKLNSSKLPITVPNETNSRTKCSVADVSFARSRMFYRRPMRVPHSNQIVVGFPERHILNLIIPSYQHQPKLQPSQFVGLDSKKLEGQARHLAKYVFPRQYSLLNPFSGPRLKNAGFDVTDYSDRESEIKGKGSCKTPKRLKHVLPLLETMIWRHGKCGYKPLRDKVCPSKLQFIGNRDLDSSVILELMSEQSSLLCTQGNITVDTSTTSVMPFGLTQAEEHAKSKPRFAEFACSIAEVYRYVVLITKVIIPRAFWGSDGNFKVILRSVREFIQCRRFESLTLHHVVQGFATSQCDWLMSPGAVGQSRVSVSDSLKRRELLEEFLFWYFDSFVSSLLKTNFYITESSAFRNRVLYFRQDDWEALCSPLIDQLTTGTFVKVPHSEAKEVLRQRELGFSFVRLLPKETGVRPIVNLRRRKAVQKGRFSLEKSINQILQAAFQILSYEKQIHPERLGASIFNPGNVYSKLKDFKSRLPRNPDGSLPRLYFVKVDVQACFDTIEQSKLLDILRQLISEDGYMIHRYGKIGMATGRIKRAFVKKAVPEDEHPHFLRHATELAKALRHTIFVDQVVYPHSQKEEILHLLEEHITENIVKIGSDFYRQTVGIPQGSILSALLCSFFYGDLEKRSTIFKDDMHGVLLRLIDDYLLVTTSHARAKQFLDMMNRGHPEYGCFISKEKTLTNFDYDSQIMNVTEPRQQSFPWCGYMINMKDLSVTADYSRYYKTSLSDTLTVARGRRPGSAFTYKMLWLTRTRCHPIYFDCAFNTERVAYLNIYQNFLLCAMKMHSYLRDFGFRMYKNSAFIYGTIQKMIVHSYSSLRGRTKRENVDGVDLVRLKVQKLVVIWLGTHAFYAVLNRKSQRYTSILRCLRSELSRPRCQRYEKRFHDLIREGQAGLSPIPF